MHSLCNNSRILGGFHVLNKDGVYLEKSFTNLPHHFKFTLRFELYLIDEWNSDPGDNDDYVEFFIDDVSYLKQNIKNSDE